MRGPDLHNPVKKMITQVKYKKFLLIIGKPYVEGQISRYLWRVSQNLIVPVEVKYKQISMSYAGHSHRNKRSQPSARSTLFSLLLEVKKNLRRSAVRIYRERGFACHMKCVLSFSWFHRELSKKFCNGFRLTHKLNFPIFIS